MRMTRFAGLGLLLALLFCLAAPSAFASDKPQIEIGLIGDSTVASTYGWGPGLADRLKDRSAIINYAKNGATLDALSKRLNDLIAQEPDYIVIQFGHNDMKRYGTEDYAKKLTGYVERIKAAGIKPIIFSSVTRRGTTPEGKVRSSIIQGRTLPEYAVAAKGVATKEQVPFVDMNAITIAHHNKVGKDEFATYNYIPTDRTHFSHKGARVVSGLVLDELLKIIPGLEAQVAEDKDEWVHLFNGKDLSGWKSSPDNPAAFSVNEAGNLVAHGTLRLRAVR